MSIQKLIVNSDNKESSCHMSNMLCSYSKHLKIMIAKVEQYKNTHQNRFSSGKTHSETHQVYCKLLLI